MTEPTDRNASVKTHNENPSSQGTFAIKHVYVREQSAKVPYAPGIYQTQSEEHKPETQVELNTQNRAIDKTQFEVTLTLTVVVKVQQQTAMNLEVVQGGLFELKGYEEKALAHLLGAYCPTILFPYARRVIANLMLDGGFPALNLPPINFEQLYQQRLKKASADQGTTADSVIAPAQRDDSIVIQ